jgi:hypothetical protein
MQAATVVTAVAVLCWSVVLQPHYGRNDTDADEEGAADARLGIPVWLASFIAAAIAEVVTLPFDTAKVRLQVAAATTATTTSATTPSSPAAGMFGCLRQIYTEEGVSGLWTGLLPALVRQCVYTPISMACFPLLRDTFGGALSDDQPSFLLRLLCGGLAGAIGISFVNPAEVAKTQLQAGRTTISTSMSQPPRCVDAIPTMYSVVRATYAVAGQCPLLLTSAVFPYSPFATTRLSTYYDVTITGGLTLALSQTHRLDRVMVMGTQRTISILTITPIPNPTPNTGLPGLWAGWGPNVTRSFIVNASELGVYDQAKAAFLASTSSPLSPFIQHVVCSAAAGFVSACTVRVF